MAVLIAYGESRMYSSAIGDTDYICKRTGLHSPSWGLVQINPCFHNVTMEQAFDLEFSVNFLIQNLKEGKCRFWMTCPLYPYAYKPSVGEVTLAQSL